MHCQKSSYTILKCVSKKLFNSLLRLTRSCGTAAAFKPNVEYNLNEKLLKVAIVGKTNAGKSTLINKMMNLNVCDVSPKAHTTLMPLKAACISGSTQILFVDTPGLVSNKETKKFDLHEKMPEWKKIVFEEVDLICVIHDATCRRLHPNLLEVVKEVPQSKTLALIINKMDLLNKKWSRDEIVKKFREQAKFTSRGENNEFSNVFLMSAIKNEGVKEFKEFLLEKAVPGKWFIKPGRITDTPLIEIIKNLARAQFLSLLKDEVPYTSEYKVDHLEQNEKGECSCLITILCLTSNHAKIICKAKVIYTACQNLKSQLFFMTGKTFGIKVVVRTKNTNV